MKRRPKSKLVTGLLRPGPTRKDWSLARHCTGVAVGVAKVKHENTAPAIVAVRFTRGLWYRRESDDYLIQNTPFNEDGYEIVLRPACRHCQLACNARTLLRRNSQVLIDQVTPGRLMDLSQQDPIDRFT